VKPKFNHATRIAVEPDLLYLLHQLHSPRGLSRACAELVEVGAAGQTGSAKADFMTACGLEPVHQCGHVTPQGIEDVQTHMGRFGKLEPDGRSRIERVRVVLLEHDGGRQCVRLCDANARGHIPQPDGSVQRPGGQTRPVRRKRHGVYIIRVAREPAELIARGHIPQPDDAVARPGGQARPVRRKRHGVYPICVAPEPAEHIARGRIPQPDGIVARPGGQARPVRRKRHGVYPIRVAREPAELIARGHIPQPDGVVARPGGQARPVR